MPNRHWASAGLGTPAYGVSTFNLFKCLLMGHSPTKRYPLVPPMGTCTSIPQSRVSHFSYPHRFHITILDLNKCHMFTAYFVTHTLWLTLTRADTHFCEPLPCQLWRFLKLYENLPIMILDPLSTWTIERYFPLISTPFLLHSKFYNVEFHVAYASISTSSAPH